MFGIIGGHNQRLQKTTVEGPGRDVILKHHSHSVDLLCDITVDLLHPEDLWVRRFDSGDFELLPEIVLDSTEGGSGGRVTILENQP